MAVSEPGRLRVVSPGEACLEMGGTALDEAFVIPGSTRENANLRFGWTTVGYIKLWHCQSHGGYGLRRLHQTLSGLVGVCKSWAGTIPRPDRMRTITHRRPAGRPQRMTTHHGLELFDLILALS